MRTTAPQLQQSLCLAVGVPPEWHPHPKRQRKILFTAFNPLAFHRAGRAPGFFKGLVLIRFCSRLDLFAFCHLRDSGPMSWDRDSGKPELCQTCTHTPLSPPRSLGGSAMTFPACSCPKPGPCGKQAEGAVPAHKCAQAETIWVTGPWSTRLPGTMPGDGDAPLQLEPSTLPRG